MEDAATGTVPEQRRYRVKRHWMRRLLSELAAFVLPWWRWRSLD